MTERAAATLASSSGEAGSEVLAEEPRAAGSEPAPGRNWGGLSRGGSGDGDGVRGNAPEGGGMSPLLRADLASRAALAAAAATSAASLPAARMRRCRASVTRVATGCSRSMVHMEGVARRWHAPTAGGKHTAKHHISQQGIYLPVNVDGVPLNKGLAGRQMPPLPRHCIRIVPKPDPNPVHCRLEQGSGKDMQRLQEAPTPPQVPTYAVHAELEPRLQHRQQRDGDGHSLDT